MLNLSTLETGVWSIDSKKISGRSIVAGIAALCVHGFVRTVHVCAENEKDRVHLGK